jgi:hypothetical protein
MRIEERWPCAACQNKRTVRFGDNREHCFNCGSQWPRVPTRLVFSEAELRRLVVYRRAIRAGFYTDELHVKYAGC